MDRVKTSGLWGRCWISSKTFTGTNARVQTVGVKTSCYSAHNNGHNHYHSWRQKKQVIPFNLIFIHQKKDLVPMAIVSGLKEKADVMMRRINLMISCYWRRSTNISFSLNRFTHSLSLAVNNKLSKRVAFLCVGTSKSCVNNWLFQFYGRSKKLGKKNFQFIWNNYFF